MEARGLAILTNTRNWRLASGCILLTYISAHMINHTLGIWSLALAEGGLTIGMMIWQSWPGTIALYGAAAVHFALALRTIFQRRHWSLPLIEWIRLWAGFSLPVLLIGHAVSTRIASSYYAFEPSYEHVVATLVANGTQGRQIALLAPGWLHGCLGLWITLRRFALMQRIKPLLVLLVGVMPLLSAAGFRAMSDAVAALHPAGASAAAPVSAQLQAALDSWRGNLTITYMLLLAGAFLAGSVRNRMQRDQH